MKRILGLVALAAIFLPARAQHSSVLKTVPSLPKQNEPLTILYHPAPADSPISVLAYVYDTLYRWRVYELPMRPAGDTAWAADWMLPGNAGFVAYAVHTTAGNDNFNDQGAFTMVRSDHAAYQAGAEAGYGLLRAPAYGLGVPGYFKNFSISDTAAYMWLSNEIIRHHNSAMKLVLPYVRAKLRFLRNEGRPEVVRAVDYLLRLKQVELSGLPSDGGGAEEPLVKAYIVCSQYLGDSARADSIRNVILVQWPHGALARLEAWQKANHATKADDRLKLTKAFVTTFPYDEAHAQMDHILGIDYYRIFRDLLAISIAQGHSEAVGLYGLLPLYNIPEAYYKAVEIPYDDWKSKDAAHAYGLSDTLYRMMLFYCRHQPASMWYYSPREWSELTEKTFSSYFRLHARMLMELGRDEEALALAQRAQAVYQLKSADLDQTEAILLQRMGKQQALDSLLRACVRVNQVTPAMFGMMRDNWIRTHSDDNGFDSWIESLKDAKTLALMRAEIEKQRLVIPAPDFSLRDAAGQAVSLRSLRGKTVVLDFWATWCAPCKAGMAGMNMAVQKYRKDTGVVFLFIDTQERDRDYKEKGRAFLKGKGYDFRVLFDEGQAMDAQYKAYASAIHSSGIPFKAVIDPGGRLRYANIGFKGSPSGLADEIGIMIELARGGIPYVSDSITYENPAGHVRIGATLSYPRDAGSRAAIVLLSGTGKQDRDGTMAGHKMFALLADSLARRGYVVIRSDDRGVGMSSGVYDSATTADFACDALAAVHYLRNRKELGLQKIGLLGHSEGGMAAAIAAAQDTGVDFVISLSAPGQRGLEALLLQNKKLVDAAPIPPVNKLRFDSLNDLLFHVVFANIGRPDLEHQLRAAYARWNKWDDSVVKANNLVDGGHFFFPFESYLRQASSRWYQYFLTYDPALVLPGVHVPYLAINGDKDRLSDGATNLAGLAAGLAAGGNQHVTTWLAPGLNHLYQHCHTCEPAEYATLSETMAPEVITRIANWMECLNRN